MNEGLDRRRVLKVVGAGGIVAITIVLPKSWIRPVVHAVVVPAHAAASPFLGTTTAGPTTTTTSGPTTPGPTVLPTGAFNPCC